MVRKNQGSAGDSASNSVVSDGTSAIDNTPREHPIYAESRMPVTKAEFGRKLYRMMIDKGWRQSELARRADMPRDSISSYVRGIAYPSATNLRKLAQALGVQPDDLIPHGYAVPAALDSAAFSTQIVSPGMYRVVVNQVLPADVAAQISALVMANDANRS